MPKRTITALGLLFIGFPALVWGGIPFFLFIAFLLTASAWEYVNLFRVIGSRPSRWLVVGGVLALALARFYLDEAAGPLFTFLVLGLMAFHLVDYERGADHAGLDFSVCEWK